MNTHPRAGRALPLALLALLALTALSWGAAHMPLGPFHSHVALSIAALKSSIVAFVFMEIGHAGLVPRFVAVLTLLFIGLMCFGILADALWR